MNTRTEARPGLIVQWNNRKCVVILAFGSEVVISPLWSEDQYRVWVSELQGAYA